MYKMKVTRDECNEERIKALKGRALRVSTDLRAGEWRCTACEGEVQGSDMFKPNCKYCEGS